MKTLLITFTAAIFSVQSLFAASDAENKQRELEIVRLLAGGDQRAAESSVLMSLQRNPQDQQSLFWSAVLLRSRFEVQSAGPRFAKTVVSNPDSPEGLASACILGIDVSKDQLSAIYYFNALLILANQHPDSIPIHWMAAVMTRTLTRSDAVNLGSDVRTRILRYGVQEYENVLALMNRVTPGPGPVLIHQTMANLLDQLDASDLALIHRQIAVKQERALWSLNALAQTLVRLGRPAEALPIAQQAISMSGNEKSYATLGDAYQLLGRLSEAVIAWDSASHYNSNNLEYLKKCVKGSRTLGNYVKAREYAREALNIDANNGFFQIWNARLAAILNEPEAPKLLNQVGTFDFRENVVVENGLPTDDPWFRAAETCDVQKLRQLIPTGDINQVIKPYNQTALINAAQMGWEPIAVELIKAHANIDQADINGDTALNYSAEFQNPRITKLLLDAGANPDIADKWNQTPLIKCTTKNNWEGFLMLLEKKLDLNFGSDSGAGTALHYAVGHGTVPMIDALIRRGANVNVIDKAGATPLMEAAEDYPHPFVINALLTAGADVNAPDNDGRTALHHAINPLMNLPLVELLLNKKADPTLADKHGTTPITQARLLGFEELARQMEKKAGHAEPAPSLHLKEFTPSDSNGSAEEQKASYYVIPILLAQGNPLGRLSGHALDQKKEARRELSRIFGIQNTSDLKQELDALEKFEPRQRDNAGDLSEIGISKETSEYLMSVVKRIHDSYSAEHADESAWTQSHIIYLADLGIDAGYLSQEEGSKLIADASSKISSSFSSWPDYVKSFILGARFHNGWEADRYEHICNHILAANVQWP